MHDDVIKWKHFPRYRPVTRSFDVFFDLGLNKQLSKQPWGWWFEMPLWSLWRQCNGQSQGGYYLYGWCEWFIPSAPGVLHKLATITSACVRIYIKRKSNHLITHLLLHIIMIFWLVISIAWDWRHLNLNNTRSQHRGLNILTNISFDIWLNIDRNMCHKVYTVLSKCLKLKLYLILSVLYLYIREVYMSVAPTSMFMDAYPRDNGIQDVLPTEWK